MEETLKGISKIFAKNVLWNKETQSLQDLKDSMALMVHLLAHNMRDARGTSAEDEWLERIVYKSLGITCMQNQANQSVDLEAFANPFISDFREEYDKMTELTF